MKCNELYAEAQKQSSEKNKFKEAALKLNESRKAELYKRLNETMFDGLDLNPDNSGIAIYSSVLEHATPNLATIARDYSVLTISIPLSSFKKPFICTTYEDFNTLKLCSFIKDFDEMTNNCLANRIVSIESEKSFKSSFNLSDLIKENKTVEKMCAEHNQYLVGFEVSINAAKTKKSKEGMILDFSFGFITNYPEIKTDHKPKSKPALGKPENATIPKVQVIEVKDPSELPKAIRDLLGEIL
jgi:hypothetical protein